MDKFSMVTVRKRVAGLLLGFSIVFLLIVFRLTYLEVIAGDRLLSAALAQRSGAIPILADRGEILDCNNNKLAVSMSTDAVYAIPAEVEDAVQTAQDLAPILDVEVTWLQERLQKKQRMVWLKLKIDPQTAKQVRELQKPGIDIVVRPQRFYPNEGLAAQLIGFAGIDNQGLEGLEAYYDRYLSGVNGMLLQERDASGRIIPGTTQQRIAPQAGNSVVLSIDQVIQYLAERELEKAVTDTKSAFGVAVFVRPKTGEVLASAVYPSFNPNEYSAVTSDIWRNRVVADQFEPGSTFKTVTGAAALEAGVVRLDEVFTDPVKLKKWGGQVSCWRAQGHGTETFVEATENSCNPIFALLAADRLGPTLFYRFISGFGFGQKTGIDLPGEATGMVPKPGQTKHGELLQWANIGFGQGIAVTPIQMVMMASAIANGGQLMKPQVVREIRDATGKVVKSFKPEAVRQVISKATAAEFAKVMRSVVVNGSGSKGEAIGFRVAGKTGTAEMPSSTGGYGDDRIASFLGFAPVDDPQIAGVVMLVKIGVRPAYGGMWAAPVFATVVDDALEYLGVERKVEKAPAATGGMVYVPNVQNLTRSEANRLLTQAGLKAVNDGAGEYVEQQMPRSGAAVKPGSAVRVSYYSEDDPGEETVVPDVIGRTMRDAAVSLGQAGLVIVVEGTGVATQQTPPAGTQIKRGERVVVKFASPR